MLKLKPLPGHVLVNVIPDEQPKSGIILPDKAVKSLSPYVRAVVLQRGTGTKQWPMREFIRDGNEVIMIPRGAGTEIVHDGVKLRLIHVSEVIGFWPTKENHTRER